MTVTLISIIYPLINIIYVISVPQDSGDYYTGRNDIDVDYNPQLKFDTTPKPVLPEDSSIFDIPQEFEGPGARIGQYLCRNCHKLLQRSKLAPSTLKQKYIKSFMVFL